MKTKLLLTFLLTAILALTLASASVSFNPSTPAVFTKTSTQTTFTITNTGSDTVNFDITIPSIIEDSSGHLITITSQSPLSYTNIITGQSTGAITLTYSGDTTNFNIGESSSNLVIRATSTSNTSNVITQTIPLKFVNDFCKYGQNGSSLNLGTISINNEDGDDFEWKPYDRIRVKVEVENNGDSKMSGVYAELGLIDSKGKNIVSNLENLSDKKLETGTINDGGSKTVEFDFQVPSDFKDDTYLLVIKAYKSGKEAGNCTSYSSDLDSGYYQSIDGARQTEQRKQIIVANIQTSPEETAKCGERVQISADVTNIGDEDYEDQVKVSLYNKDLKLDTEQVIRGDLNQGDTENVNFEFDVPTDVLEKTYTLEFRTYYDYNGGDSYRLSSSQLFTVPLKISGDCKSTPSVSRPNTQITAELDPETPQAISGKQVIIKATVKNQGTAEAPYTVSVYGNSAWSSLVSVTPETFTLAPGASKDVSIVLNVDSAAEGDKEFAIRATSGSSTPAEQRVSLSISKQTLQFSSIVDHFKKNWFIYLIVLVNVVLIIAIVIVIKRMVSPRKRRDFE